MAFSRSARILTLLIIDIAFFFLELIVGYAVGSLALVADSFHMLNDVLSLLVALYAIKLTHASVPSDSRYSYGWHRAEILAALINGVFLLALCFSIALEAIGRFFTTPDISNPKLVVIVGSFGLASNIVGLFLFHEHGPPPPAQKHLDSSRLSSPSQISIGGDVFPTQNTSGRSRSDSHSHIAMVHSPSESFLGHPAATRASIVQTANELASTASHLSEDTPLLREEHEESPHNHGHRHGHEHGHHGSMNMRALLLHVLGDALGNVGVIATGLVIWLTSWQYKYYFDPLISLVITVIIFSNALPLVRSTSFILLQGVPSTVSLDEVKNSILDIDGVLSLHELHVWQLSENKLVASVHVLASRNHDFMPVALKIRKVLHYLGIHSCTIQPEYYHPNSTIPDERLKTIGDTSCLLLCPTDEICDPAQNACCPPPPQIVDV